MMSKAKTTPKRQRGGQSIYTQKIADEICDRLKKGESLRAICRSDGMPDESTVREWALENREGFFPQYARARELQYLAIAEELLDIADDGRNDWMVKNDRDNPGYDLNGEHIQRSRVRIDTRKWMLSKMLPKVYGDRIGSDKGSEETERTVNIKITGGLPD